MPEEIIRSYLVNPLLYEDSSFCCGCGDYINTARLTWQETGETVMDYMGQLRKDYVQRAYGISVADTASGIVVTPPAVEAVHAMARKAAVNSTYYFSLDVVETESSINYKGKMVFGWIGKVTVEMESAGIKFVVQKSQAKRIKGTIIHYEAGPLAGFHFRRLHTPR